ncbi:MAG: hypothetical protein DRP79_06010 [Planctomycetota bacterium]|nr:MAG: hypothetical protein DRP79_06010 [Planctomycetota bacterium]
MFRVMHISIKKEIFYEMLSHCLREGPLEACGFLSGAGEIIEKMHKMKPLNDAAASFNPSETFRVSGEIQALGHKWLGVFRAHAADGRPTQTDIDFSTDPDVVQFIVALSDEGLPVIKAYRIEGGKADEIHIEIE